MPRNNDPAGIVVGTGLAADDSIEANALIHPTGGNDGLRVHIDDPSRAHMAASIGIVDAGGYYVSDEVEGALQEIGASHSAGRSNGLISGGTFSTVGLTLTLDPGTVVLLNGTATDYSGVSVALIDNQTQYVYIDASTGNLTTNLAVPALAGEPVWFAEVTTAAGVVTGSRDARFFVINLDRKPTLTMRTEGGATNRNSEGAFETLEAAFFYLETYATTEVETFRIMLRGNIQLGQTYAVPAGEVTLEGEGGVQISTGAALAPMFDLAGNKSVTFRNLSFVCDHAGSTAISDGGVGSPGLTIEDCQFISGAQNWDSAISCTNNAGPNDGHIYRDLAIYAISTAITLDRPNNCVLENIRIENPTGAAGAAALLLNSTGPYGGEGFTRVSNVRSSGFLTSMVVAGEDMTVRSCKMLGSRDGLDITGGFRFTVDDCLIFLNGADAATGGQDGITITGTQDVKIRGCRVVNPRASWVSNPGTTPDGITIDGASNYIYVSDCQIQNFYNDNTPLGFGVNVAAGANTVSVTDTVIRATDVGVSMTGDNLKVHNCEITRVRIGVLSAVYNTTVTDTRIECEKDYGENGIDVLQSSFRIANCKITTERDPATYAAGDWPTGIYIGDPANDTHDIVIEGCEIRDFLNNVAAALRGSGVLVTTGATSVQDITVDACDIQGVADGVRVFTATDKMKVAGTTILDMENGVINSAGGTDLVVSDCIFVHNDDPGASWDAVGTDGVFSSIPNTVVTGCIFKNQRSVWDTTTLPRGIYLGGLDSQATDNRVTGYNNPLRLPNPLGFGVLCTEPGVKVEGNNISNVIEGVRLQGDLSAGKVNDNFIEGGAIVEIGINIDGESGPIYDVDVSNNTVVGCVTAGIRAVGDVRDSVIDGNMVDMILPLPPPDDTNPTATGIVLTSSPGIGAPIRVVISDNDVWRAANGIIANGALAERMEYLTVEGNRVHHCGYAQDLSVATPDTFAGRGSKGIGIDFGWKCIVHGNDVSRIGLIEDLAGVETAPNLGPPTDSVQALGIYLRNCDQMGVQENGVEDTFSTLGSAGPQGVRNIGIYSETHSTGLLAGTITVNDMQFANNRCFWAAGNNGENGIRFEASLGTDPGAAVDYQVHGLTLLDNEVTATLLDGIIVRVGDGTTMERTLIAHNSLQTVAVAGAPGAEAAIKVEGFDEGLGFPINIQQVGVRGNVVRDTSADGIFVTSAKTDFLQHVDIEGNKVQNSTGNGIAVTATAAMTAFTNINVDGNECGGLGAGQVGVRIAATTPLVSAVRKLSARRNIVTSVTGTHGVRVQAAGMNLSDVRIDGNEVLGPTGPFGGVGIALEVTTGATQNVDLDNLHFSDNTVHTDTGDGLYFNLDGRVTNALLSNNTAKVEAAPGRPLEFGVRYGGSAGGVTPHRDIVMLGNVLLGGVGSLIGFSGDFAQPVGNQGPGIQNFSFNDNTVREALTDSGMTFLLDYINSGTQPVISGLTFNDNTFSDCADEGLYLEFGGVGDAISGIANTDISHNRFARCQQVTTTVAEALRVQSYGYIENLSITDNEYTETFLGVLTSDTTGTVRLLLGHNASTPNRDIRIEGNLFQANEAAGILVEDFGPATNKNLEGLVVSGNQFRWQRNVPIKLDLASFGTDQGVRQVQADHNVMRDILGGGGSTNGIYLLCPTAPVANVEQVQIVDNTIQSANWGVAVDVPVGIDDLKISRNQILDSGNRGISFVLDDLANAVSVDDNHIEGGGYGIYIQATGNGAGNAGIDDISVCRNKCLTQSIQGIRVWCQDAAVISRLVNASVNGNQVEDSGSESVYVETTDGDAENVSISRNEIIDSGGDGIFFTTDEGSVRNLRVNGNGVGNPGDIGIHLVPGDGTSPPNVEGVVVSGNTVNDAFHEGIYLTSGGGADWYSIAVTDNTVRDWSTDGVSNNHGVRVQNAVSGADCQAIVVANNALNTGASGAGGIQVNFVNNALIGAVISNNTVVHLSGVSTSSMDLTWDTGSQNIAVNGNSLYGAGTGVTFGAGGTAANYGTCSANNERTSAGAGNWAAFYAAAFVGGTSDNTGLNQD